MYAHTLWRRTTKFDVAIYGEGDCLGAQPRSTPRGRGPNAPNFGVLSIYAHTLSQKYQIWRGNAWGRGWASSQPHLPSQESGVPGLPNIGCFPVFIRFLT